MNGASNRTNLSGIREDHIVSQQRVVRHGEVYTRQREVNGCLFKQCDSSFHGRQERESTRVLPPFSALEEALFILTSVKANSLVHYLDIGESANERESGYNPNVLNCIADVSRDEFFAPPKQVNRMFELLPPELWSDANASFFDPVYKLGVFPREIAMRRGAGLDT